MKIVPRHKSQGIAIIIVMVSIFILSILAAGFAYSMKVESKLAANADNESEMEWVARSGVEYARWILGQQLKIANEPYDSLDQKWAGGTTDTNAIFADVSLDDVQVGAHSKFSIKITDTERKFNINTAVQNEAILQHALIMVGVDASDSPTIVSSIEDWIDLDDDTRVNGAETEYYQSLDPPYVAKNGPIDDISELLLIKGVTPEIFFGPTWSNHPPPSFQAKSSLFNTTPGASAPSAGLADLFTPFSSGLINILTASKEQLGVVTGLLQGSPGGEDPEADSIITVREQSLGENGILPFRSAQDVLVNTVGGQQAAQVLAPFFTIRSTTFEVQIDVDVGQSHRTYYALLHRNAPNDIQIMNFRWEE